MQTHRALLVCVAAFATAVVQGSGEVYSQYTLDGRTVEDTFGRTSSKKKIARGALADAVCGQSYHMREMDFIDLGASNGAPTGKVDFSMAGYVKPVRMTGFRALMSIGATFPSYDETPSRGDWGAWVGVDRSGQLSVRTLMRRLYTRTRLVEGKWAFVLLSYTAHDTMLRLAVNGEEVLARRVEMDLRRNSRYGGMAIGEYHLGGSPWGRAGEFFVDHVSFVSYAVDHRNAVDVAAPCPFGQQLVLPATAPAP